MGHAVPGSARWFRYLLAIGDQRGESDRTAGDLSLPPTPVRADSGVALSNYPALHLARLGFGRDPPWRLQGKRGG
jgi:hypothetical protein